MPDKVSSRKKTVKSLPDQVTHVYTDGSYRPDGNAAYALFLFTQKNKDAILQLAKDHLVFSPRTFDLVNDCGPVFLDKAKDLATAECCTKRGCTINQMELESINRALDHPGDHFIIYSDSSYAISCLTLWYKTWRRHNWMNFSGVPVKNKELIQEILGKMESKKKIGFIKVSAHSGDPFNAVVDYLAQSLTVKMRGDPRLPDGFHSL